MHATLRHAVLALALLAAPAAHAQVKIGYADFRYAVAECDEGKAGLSALERDAKEKEKAFNVKREELGRALAEYQKQSGILTPEAKAAKEAELQRRDGELGELSNRLKQEFNKKQSDLMGGVAERMMGVARDLAESEGYTIILEKAAVIYAPAGAATDLTNKLIGLHNKKNPPGAKPAAATPAAPKK